MTNNEIEIALISMFMILGYTIRGVIDTQDYCGVLANKGETQARVGVTGSERDQNDRSGMHQLLTHRMSKMLAPAGERE